MQKEVKTKKEKETAIRPPIVVVMGHIDHGKTKILDWYRKTKLVEEESGGITQHIGAYEVLHKGKNITFIDTPGHEAFSALRSRGAKVADMAILVVAAEEGVKPQTKEAIRIIQENNIPFVVAINKIDKPEANPERVKGELAEENVLVESYGGKVPSVEISAKLGTNMDELLEVLLLVAELEDLKTNPEKPAEGVVIETHRDPQRGITSTLLIIEGALAKGDFIATACGPESIKILEDFRAHAITKAGPSSPVRVAGLGRLPMVGDRFQTFKTRGEAETYVASLPKEEKTATQPASAKIDEARPIFNIVLKADVVGSQEALAESLKKLESDAVGINIIKSEVGDINESDVKLAMSTKLVTIIGFKVKLDPSVRQLAESANTHILTGDVIYNLLDAVKKEASEIILPEIKRTDMGRTKILKIFKSDGVKQIIGGRVEEGLIKKAAKIEIQRLKEVIGQGEILQLQHNKQDVTEVEKGLEFGMLVESKTTIQENDVLAVFEEETIKRTL